jgi:hypothetical protein
MSEGNGVDTTASEASPIDPVPIDPAADPNVTDVPRPAKKRRKAPGELAGTRIPDDAYDTDPALALACCEWLVKRDCVLADSRLLDDRGQVKWNSPDINPKTPNILDPTAGNGPFAKAADVVWPHAKVVAVDIRPECAASYVGGRAKFVCADAFTLPPALIAQVDLIVTNPPFKRADELVRYFWAHMKPGAVLTFLLNITFLGSEDRWEPEGLAQSQTGGLFQVAPLRYCVPIVPRPSFLTVDGKSTSPKFEAALFVWRKNGGGATDENFPGAIIPRDPIRWAKAKKKRKSQE